MVNRAWGSATSSLSIPSSISNLPITNSSRRQASFRTSEENVHIARNVARNTARERLSLTQPSLVAGATLNTATAMRRTRIRGDSCWICNTSVMTTPIVEHMVHYHPGCGSQLSRSSGSTETAHCGGLVGQIYQLCPLCLERYSYEFQSFSPFLSTPSSVGEGDSLDRQVPPTPTTRSSIGPVLSSSISPTNKKAPDLLYPVELNTFDEELSTDDKQVSGSNFTNRRLDCCALQWQLLMLQFEADNNQDWVKPSNVFKAADPLGSSLVATDSSLEYEVPTIENGVPNCGMHENGQQNNMHKSSYCYYCTFSGISVTDPLHVQCFSVDSTRDNVLALQRIMQISRQQLSRKFILGVLWNLLAGKSIKTRIPQNAESFQISPQHKTLKCIMDDEGIAKYLITNGLSNIQLLYHLYIGMSKLATKQKETYSYLVGLETAIKCIVKYCQASRQFIANSCCEILLDIASGNNKAEEESHYGRMQQREAEINSTANELNSQVAMLNVSQRISKMLIDSTNVRLIDHTQPDCDSIATFPVELDETDKKILADSFGHRSGFHAIKADILPNEGEGSDDEAQVESKRKSGKELINELAPSPDSLKIADALAAIIMSSHSSSNLRTWATNLLMQYLFEVKESSRPIFSAISHADLNQSLPEFKCKMINICSVEANEIDVENTTAICDQKIEGILDYAATPGSNEHSLIAIVDSHKKIHVHNVTSADSEYMKRYETFNSNWPITLDGNQLLSHSQSTSLELDLSEGEEESELVLLSSAFSTSSLDNLCWLWSTVGSETSVPSSFGIAATIENFVLIFKSTAGHWMEIETPPTCVVRQHSKVTKLLRLPNISHAWHKEKDMIKESIEDEEETDSEEEEFNLVVGRYDGTVALYSCRETNELPMLSRPGIPVADLTWLDSHEGEGNRNDFHLVVAFQDGVVLLASHEHLRSMLEDQHLVEAGSSAPADGENTEIFTLSSHNSTKQLSHVEFSPNQLLLAGLAIGSSSNVAVWHIADVFNSENQVLEPISLPHPSNIYSLTWSSYKGNGAVLAVGQEDGGIAIWNIDTCSSGSEPKHICLLWGHSGMVVSNLKFHPTNGDILASFSTKSHSSNKCENIANIWSLSVGSVIQTLSSTRKKQESPKEETDIDVHRSDQLSLSTDSPTSVSPTSISQDSKNERLVWVDQSTLVIGFPNSEVVHLAFVPLSDSNFMVDIRMASAFRMALLGRIEETKIFSKTKCLKYFLRNFGSILQAQRRYENNFVNRSQDQLVYSRFMQILLVWSTSFRLYRVVQGLEEWSWLPEYAYAMQALSSVVSPMKNIDMGTLGKLFNSDLSCNIRIEGSCCEQELTCVIQI